MQQATRNARTYWRGQDAGYEEEMGIFGVAEGAFTEPGAEQQAVLYLMSRWPRCCPKMGLAILEGDKLIRNVAFVGIAQSLSAVPDLDGDGRDELVTTGSFGMGGDNSGSMTLLSFSADGLTEWGSAPTYQNSCAAGRDGSTASRITALPGPSFTTEQFEQASCEDTTWRPVGEPEPLTLNSPPESSYVELPTE